MGMAFLQGEIETPGQGRQQDQQPVRIQFSKATITRHHDPRTEQAAQHTDPLPAVDPVLEHEMRQ
ncbi:hypothetical protein D3C81_1396450 [compost metagenome]